MRIIFSLLLGATLSVAAQTPVADPLTVTYAEDTVPAPEFQLSANGGETNFTFTIVQKPLYGTNVLASQGRYRYEPYTTTNFFGKDTFTFTVTSGTNVSLPATVTINITNINDAPFAHNAFYKTMPNQAVQVRLTGDDDGDFPLYATNATQKIHYSPALNSLELAGAIKYTLLDDPTNGTLTGTAPLLTYTPDLDATGIDSFTFKVNDGQVDSSNVATVMVRVANFQLQTDTSNLMHSNPVPNSGTVRPGFERQMFNQTNGTVQIGSGSPLQQQQGRVDDAYRLLNLNTPEFQNRFGAPPLMRYANSNYSGMYVGNNGIVSFRQGIPGFIGSAFPLHPNLGPLLSPFWADVDTRTAKGGILTYDIGYVEGRRAIGFTWNDVGYYSAKSNLLNRFQLVLIDASDWGPGQYRAEFNYEYVEWLSGDASVGTYPSVGFDYGDGVTYFNVVGSRTPSVANYPTNSNLIPPLPGRMQFALGNPFDNVGFSRTLTNQPATDVGAAEATLRAAVSNLGGTWALTAFQYSTNATNWSSISDYVWIGGLTNVPTIVTLTNLQPLTTYYYRPLLFGQSLLGFSETLGDVLSFTTFSQPVVVASNTVTNNLLRGWVNPGGTNTMAWFEWGTTTNYGQFSTPVALTNGMPRPVSQQLTNLEYGNSYHFRIVATNVFGITYSTNESFIAPPVLPTVITQPATDIGGQSVTLNATVTVNGANTTNYFQLGTTTNYSQLITGPVLPFAAGANPPLSVAIPVTDLDYGTTYYFRAMAVNAAGTNYGAPESFSTLTMPAIVVAPQTQVAPEGADVLFTVSAIGTAPLSYQWKFNDEEIANATSTALALNNVSTNQSGTYSIVITNAVGMTSASALLTVLETNRPVVVISAPAAGASLVTSDTTISGTATDNIAVTAIQYSLNASAFQPLPLASNAPLVHWSLQVTGLSVGTNTIALKAFDAALNESPVVQRTFFHVVTNQFTLLTNGSGGIRSFASRFGTRATPTNGAWLEIGRPYTIQAIPAAGSVLTNWTRIDGGITNVISTAASLSFVMESNLVLSANFIPNPFAQAAGVYNGLFSDEEVQFKSAGFLTLKVTAKQGVSGKMLIDGDAIGFSGKLNVDGTGTLVSKGRLVKRGKPDLGINVNVDFENRKVTGLIAEGTNWSATFLTHRVNWTPVIVADGYTNKYTFVVPAGGEGPVGSGYGLVTVNPRGRLRLSGRGADGTVLRQGTIISSHGDWPFFAGMYPQFREYNGKIFKETKGFMMGWLKFDPNVLDHMAPTGQVHWINTGWASSMYAGGFTNAIDIKGSRWLVEPNVPALAASTVTLDFTGGNLDAMQATYLLDSKSLLKAISGNTYPNTLKAALAPKTGLMQGRFYHPETPLLPTLWYGAVLQDENSGEGFFHGPAAGGKVSLEITEE